MKILLCAIALSVALPAVAHAKEAPAPAPAPAPKKECCCMMMGRKMDCCKDQGDRPKPDGKDDPAAHPMNH